VGIGGHAVLIRTEEVQTPATARVYAKIQVGANRQNEPLTTYDEASWNFDGQLPTIRPEWRTIHFIGGGVRQVRIRYTLFAQTDADSSHDKKFTLSGDNDLIKDVDYIYDLNTRHLTNNRTTRDLQTNTVETEGQTAESGRVTLTVTHAPLVP
jgi:hypothetical protein